MSTQAESRNRGASRAAPSAGRSPAAVRVVTLPGDGIGPEVIEVAVAVLSAACSEGGITLHVEERPVGGRAIDETGMPLPPATLEACRGADAVLLGAVGGPRWDHLRGAMRCEAGLLGLRRGLRVFANLRPVRVHPALADRSPVRREVVSGTDLMIVRELTGGAYFGEPRERSGEGPTEAARDSTVYTALEIERVARVAFRLASARHRRLISVDKANVLITSQLWRETVTRVAADYPDVALEHQLVDSFAVRLMRQPAGIDVVVTENLFGDILSDEAGVLAGSLGMLPSASLGDAGPGLYEPVHGSAPDIAGRGIANPYGAILSVAMLLRHSLGRDDLAGAVEAAVDGCIVAGLLGADLAGSAGTRAIGEAVLRETGRRLAAAGADR
ncbi:MAG TPA: 3-isopropylmalate dehydrogenase [Candidatus Binatia bacterium]|nr:3-isopropylmalate dehydrogenase [Candidatus Binatia bacterium]